MAKSHTENQNKKASIMFLSKEITSKDQELKSQMAILFQDDLSKNIDKVWQESGFFDGHRSDLTTPKANFYENTLLYINQGSVSFIKGGGQAIYLEFVVCVQLMPVGNPDPTINLETHVFKENKALLYVPIYNKATGLYGGLTKKLAHITLRGDDSERFYSYGYSKENSILLYCTMKHPLLNIFHCNDFKKHHGFILDENQKKAKFSKIILHLPSTLDRKEDFLQWKDHVHLHPIDVSYDELKAIHNDGEINPALLDHKELRKEVTDGYYKMMKKIAEVSNQNLVRNSDTYISNGEKIDQMTSFLGLMVLIS